MTAIRRTLVSMSEIMRVAPWALRAVGYPFGTAERATRLLTWTEAATGRGLEMLRTCADAIKASTAIQSPRRTHEAGQSRVMDAAGRFLFDVGPPAIDLATRDFRTQNSAHVIVRDALGLELVPSLTDLAARRDLSIVVVYRSDSRELSDGKPAATGWAAVVQTGSTPLFMGGDLKAGQDLIDQLDAAAISRRDAEDDRILRDATAALTGPSGYIGITALSSVSNPRAATAVDYASRVAKAYRQGLEVATVDIENLYALERLTWAPTSERSRKQAGY